MPSVRAATKLNKKGRRSVSPPWFHGPLGRGDVYRALLRPDPKPPARVRRAAVGTVCLLVRVALGRVRPGHPRLGRLLRTLYAVRRAGVLGQPPRRVDPGADGRQRGARAL